MMQLIEKFLTSANRCVTDGRWLNPPKGLMLHSVGTPQPSALVFYNNWNKSTAEAAVHAVVEPTGNVYQFLQWNKRGWHSGSWTDPKDPRHTRALNNYYIGVEMTEPKGIKYVGSGANWIFTDKTNATAHILNTYHYAVELFAYLCEKLNLDPLGTNELYDTQTGEKIMVPVIVSHAEGAALKFAYAHADVEHIWDKMGLTMDKFRKDVRAAMTPTPSAADILKINLLYATLLGREPDESGRKSWLNVLMSQGLEAVYKGIADSKEGRKYFTKCLYRSMLGRAGKAAEINYWAEKSREQIYNGITGSEEYKKKHEK